MEDAQWEADRIEPSASCGYKFKATAGQGLCTELAGGLQGGNERPGFKFWFCHSAHGLWCVLSHSVTHSITWKGRQGQGRRCEQAGTL